MRPASAGKSAAAWNFSQLFSGGDGVIYAIKDNESVGKRVGVGWSDAAFKLVFAQP